MLYEIAFEQRAAYLYARITGDNNPETIIEYLQEIAGKCTDINCFRVLIHECLDGPRLKTMELFETLSEVCKNVLGQFDAVAYVDEKMDELMDFGEDVAINRGLPVAAFTDIDDATRWILQQDTAADRLRIFCGRMVEDESSAE